MKSKIINIKKRSFQNKQIEYNEDAEKLEELNSPMGNFIINGVMTSTILSFYYSLNDLMGFEPYLEGVGNNIDNVLATGGFLSLLITYKIKLKKDKKELEMKLKNIDEKNEKNGKILSYKRG